MRSFLIIAASLALGAVSACAAGGDGQAPGGKAAADAMAVHAESGLPLVPLTITHNDQMHRFSVEYAGTAAAQQKGLMFRTQLGPDEGMVFPNAMAQPRSFWMKNTVIPLDLIFIAPDRTIESIAANATPYSLDTISSHGPVIGVLELAGGRAAELGLQAGDKIGWSTPQTAPGQ